MFKSSAMGNESDLILDIMLKCALEAREGIFEY
jgi:predicted Zn-dependent peptidase